MRWGKEAEEIAAKFARGNDRAPFFRGDGSLEWWVHRPTRNVDQDGGSLERANGPVIHGVSGIDGEEKASSVVAFRLACRYLSEKTVDVGDHVVVFGQVIEAHEGQDQARGKTTRKTASLLYVDGQYSHTVDR